jgi:hypothetical protein
MITVEQGDVKQIAVSSPTPNGNDCLSVLDDLLIRFKFELPFGNLCL